MSIQEIIMSFNTNRVELLEFYTINEFNSIASKVLKLELLLQIRDFVIQNNKKEQYDKAISKFCNIINESIFKATSPKARLKRTINKFYKENKNKYSASNQESIDIILEKTKNIPMPTINPCPYDPFDIDNEFTWVGEDTNSRVTLGKRSSHVVRTSNPLTTLKFKL